MLWQLITGQRNRNFIEHLQGNIDYDDRVVNTRFVS